MYVTFYTKLQIMTLNIHDTDLYSFLKMFIFIYLKLFIIFNLHEVNSSKYLNMLISM